jgi:hypothetical protein
MTLPSSNRWSNQQVLCSSHPWHLMLCDARHLGGRIRKFIGPVPVVDNVVAIA